MTLGAFKKFQADDYLMVIVLCFYTTLIATINIVRDTSSNLLPPGYDINNLTPDEVQERQYGSKLILVVEQCQCVTIWGAKGCLILLYLRLTTVHKENIAIKVLAAYVVITFIVMDVLYFGVWCQPFSNYWAVPTPNRQCSAATDHLITNAVFNLTSDCAMLIIGLPMFLRLHLPWKKKAAVVGVFSLGIFTILAAILNKVYSFSQPFGAAWTYWYVRESSTALLVANLPFVWTIWRKITGMKSGSGSEDEAKTARTSPAGYGNGTAERKAAAPATADDILSDLNCEEMEMAEGTGRALSFAEMLEEQNPASKGEKEPTPFTHPQLFYSRRGTGVDGSVDSRLEKAVLKDTPEQATLRRDSNPEEKLGTTPESSAFPSLRSQKSAGSFV